MKRRRMCIGQKRRSSDAAGTERVEKNRLEHIKLNNQYMMTTIKGASRKEKIHKSQTYDSVTYRKTRLNTRTVCLVQRKDNNKQKVPLQLNIYVVNRQGINMSSEPQCVSS